MTLNIDPKKRVELILRGIADNFITAANAMKAGDEDKMLNWLKCGLGCVDPLMQSIEMLHQKNNVIEKLKSDLEN